MSVMTNCYINLYECPGFYYTGNPHSSRSKSEAVARAMAIRYEAKLMLRVHVKLKPPYVYTTLGGLIKVKS